MDLLLQRKEDRQLAFPDYMSTKWPHSSVLRCSLFVFAKYVSSDLVLATNFGLHVPLLYPPLRTMIEFVLDGDADEEDDDVGSADTEGLCDDEK